MQAFQISFFYLYVKDTCRLNGTHKASDLRARTCCGSSKSKLPSAFVAHWIFTVLGTILCKPWRWQWCWENLKISPAVCELNRQAALTTMITMFKVTSVAFLPHSVARFELLQVVFATSPCQDALRCYHTIRQTTCVSRQLNILPHKEASVCVWTLHRSREARTERMPEREVKTVSSAKLQPPELKIPIRRCAGV